MASKVHFTLLSRNNSEPKSELQEVFELRSKLQEDLHEIDTEIQRLKEKRAGVQKSIDVYNLILSATRIPPDILREIFYHCLPTDRNPTLSATEAPMLLTRVCSSWRAVALTSPRIWAKLHIALPGNPTLSSTFGTLTNDAFAKRQQVFSKVMELRCCAVKDWLTRSGTCPLSISVSYPLAYIEAIDDSGYQRQPYDITEPLFRLILSFSPRWKHIDLCMPFSVYQELEGHVSADVLPLLYSFRGNVQWNDTVSDQQWSETVSNPDCLPIRFLQAPNLRALSLNSPHLMQKISSFPAIWGHLTDLHFRSKIVDVDFFNIIQLCNNLVTCQVDNMQGLWEHPAQDFRRDSVILPNLKMLVIFESDRPSHVLRALNMPSLKSLYYQCPARYHYEGLNSVSLMRADALIAVFENGTSMLRKLTLEPQYLLPEDILTCLRLASGVSHLILDGARYLASDTEDDMLYGEDFFDLNLLSVQDNSSYPCGPKNILLPKLEILEVNDILQFTDEEILCFLTNRIDAARRGEVSPLRCLKLQMLRQRHRDIREEALEHAKSAGFDLKLELIYPPEIPLHKRRLAPSFSIPPRIVNPLEETWPPSLCSLDG